MVSFDRSSICLTVVSVVFPWSFDRFCVHIRSSLKYLVFVMGFTETTRPQSHRNSFMGLLRIPKLFVQQFPILKFETASGDCPNAWSELSRGNVTMRAWMCCFRVMFNYTIIPTKQMCVGPQQTLSGHKKRSTCFMRTEGPMP